MKNYFKKIKGFYSLKVNVLLSLITAFFIVGFSLFYIFAVNITRLLMTEQTYRKGELIAKSESRLIETFLEYTVNSLLFLSRDFSIASEKEPMQEVLNEYIRDWEETPVVGVARFDSEGHILFTANNIGVSDNRLTEFVFSDRDYFVWASEASEGEFYFGNPFIPRVGITKHGYMIPLSTPVFSDGEFDGVLLVLVSLSEMTKVFISDLHVSPNHRVFLFYSDGTVLISYPENENITGVNVLEYISENSYPESENTLSLLEGLIESNDPGKLDLILPFGEKQPARFLVSHFPVVYDGEHWSLVVAVPESDINTELHTLKTLKIFMLSFCIFMVLALSLVSVLIIRISRKNAYFNGLKDGKNGKN